MKKSDKWYTIKKAKEIANLLIKLQRKSVKDMKENKDSEIWYLYIPERRKK